MEANEIPPSSSWTDRLSFSGSLWEYLLYQNNNYFSNTEDFWLESVGRLGMEFEWTDQISVQLQVTGQATNGDADDYNLVAGDDYSFEVDLANIKFSNILGAPLALTLGRQDIQFGDGFIIYDGYYDASAVWLTPITSFNAARLTFTPGPFTFDLFFAETMVAAQNFEIVLLDSTEYAGRRTLWGLNSNLKSEVIGEWDLGVFVFDDKSAIDSNTIALSLRGAYETQTSPAFSLTGEIVAQYGDTKASNNALTQTTQDREAIGGHIDAKLSFNDVTFAPYVMGRFSHFSGDDPATSANEAFDHLLYNNYEWGQWSAGNINGYNLINSNEQVVMAELGISPTDTTMIRTQYYIFWLDKEVLAGSGTKWSEEVNVIFDWFPSDNFFTGMELGWARPLKAAQDLFGDKETTEIIMWAGVEF
ncbi:MAG: alginate export family protein [Nitrospinales bacterium]